MALEDRVKMALEDSERIYVRRPFIGVTDQKRIMLSAGYLLATMGDKPTHAICMHGVIAGATARHHSCLWSLLVAKPLRQPQ